MTPVQAVETCFRKYVTFRGRATRSEFWWWMLGWAILNLICGQFETLGTIEVLALLLPTLAVAFRRLHDVNRSGANVLLPIVAWMVAAGSAQPGANVGTAALLTFEGIAIAFVLLFAYWCAQPGTPGSNRFGDDPLVVAAQE